MSAEADTGLLNHFKIERNEENVMGRNIAIDGPAGAGKSTIAKKAAKELGFIYVDTGAMYRAIALYFLRQKTDLTDENAINRACAEIDIKIRYEEGVQQVLLNGENVNSSIRREEVGNMASKTSAFPQVRAKLLDLQRKLAAEEDVIMDGRDIGTCVLPEAELKIYLTASVQTRAKRRFLELQEKGVSVDLSEVERDIEKRDYQDMHRETAPLKQADDAILIDSSELTIDQVVQKIISCFQKNVIVAKSAGFCFGVKRAVENVYEAVETSGKKVYTYGPVIHNEEVMEDLEKKGVGVLNEKEELIQAKDGLVVIRSHGVGKEIYDYLENEGIRYLDVTCPFVKKIHNLVNRYHREGYHIVVIGNAEHPEIIGVCGWCDPAQTTVIDSLEEAGKIALPENKKLCIVVQTTYNYKKFKDIVEIIEKKGYYINVLNTICSATDERQTETAQIASEVDAMIVIGSRNSSNTRKLFEISKRECENTYYIQTMEDLDLSALKNVNNVGITAGASTPNNIIEEVQNNVRIKF